jgi:hypothetical protein
LLAASSARSRSAMRLIQLAVGSGGRFGGHGAAT